MEVIHRPIPTPTAKSRLGKTEISGAGEKDLRTESFPHRAREEQLKPECESVLLEIREKLTRYILKIKSAEVETKRTSARIRSLLFPANPEEYFSEFEGREHPSLLWMFRDVMRIPTRVKIFFLEERMQTLQRIQVKNKTELLKILFSIAERSETEFQLLSARPPGDLQSQQLQLQREIDHSLQLIEEAAQAKDTLPSSHDPSVETKRIQWEQRIKEYQSHLNTLQERQVRVAQEREWREQVLPYIRRYIEANSMLRAQGHRYYRKQFSLAAQTNPLGAVDPLGPKT